MLWYYVVNGERQGPVDTETFKQLAASGTIGPDTLVWREGMSEWRAYRLVALMGVPTDAAQSAPVFATAEPAEGQVNCSECGRIFPVNEVLDYAGKKICADCKPAFFQKLRESGEASVLSDMNYAGFWIRFGAKFIDGIIINAVSMATQAVVGISTFSPTRNVEMMQKNTGLFIAFAYAIPLVFTVLYETIMNGRFGATVGKLAVGVRIVRSDGGAITYGRAFGRYWAEMVSSLCCNIGYIMAGFDNPQKRALHDRMCDTRVIYKKK